jgi:hypothetical protein
VRDVSEQTFLDDLLLAFDEVRRAPALHTHLNDSLVFTGRGQRGCTLCHIDADRLLDVDVRAGFDGGDRRQGVPVIRCADDDDIQVLFPEHGAVIAVKAGFLSGRLSRGDEVGRLRQHLAVDVADRDDIDRRDLNESEKVGLAIPAGTDETDAKCFLFRAVRHVAAKKGCKRSSYAGFEQFATVHV